MTILNMIIIAYLYRWRGSGKDPKECWLNHIIKSKGPKQVILGIVMAGMLYLNDISILRSCIAGLFFFLMIMPSWGMVFDCGRGTFDPKRWKGWYKILPMEQADWTFTQKRIVDDCGLVIRGLMITVPVGLSSGVYWTALLGALMPVCYETGWCISERVKKHIDATKISEYVFGAILGLMAGIYLI